MQEETLLPIVSPATAANVNRDLCDRFDGEFIKVHLKRLDEENPTIAYFIRKYAKTTEDKTGAAMCALIVYRLLESQAEADQMAEDFA